MNVETWLVVIVSAIVIPSVGWLVREVLRMRLKLAELDVRLTGREAECQRHQKWAGTMQETLSRIERAVARLCQKAGVKED